MRALFLRFFFAHFNDLHVKCTTSVVLLPASQLITSCALNLNDNNINRVLARAAHLHLRVIPPKASERVCT